MTLVPGERTLQAAANELQLRFESPAVDGVQAGQDLHLKRGDYTIGVKHEVINDGSQPVSPQLYLQLARDGNRARGRVERSTSPSPARRCTPKPSKFQKIDFKDIEKGKAGTRQPVADNGWVAMVQHYFASAWLLAGRNEQREFPRASACPTTCTPSPWSCRWARWPRAASKALEVARSSPARRKKTSSPRWRRGSSW